MNPDVWVEVDLRALRHNLRQVRSCVGPHVQIMAVVKGNGFGHGFVEPARTFLDAGADYLAVTRLEEALPIRSAGITAPLLLFAPLQTDNVLPALERDLDCTVDSLITAQALSTSAVRLAKTARIHLKVDTGMGRIGILPNDFPSLFDAVSQLPSLQIVGIYTHFATAAERDLTSCRHQLTRFEMIRQSLSRNGPLPLFHAANSAAILRLPNARFDMVRPGTLLYGQYPSSHVPRDLQLQPTWKLKARICSVRDLPSGTAIGYGAEAVTRRPTRIAVAPVGYADGFTLSPEGPLYRQPAFKLLAKKYSRALAMEINGVKAPVLGRVSMQFTVLDVTEHPRVAIGDEVVVPAMRLATNALLPRVYMGEESS